MWSLPALEDEGLVEDDGRELPQVWLAEVGRGVEGTGAPAEGGLLVPGGAAHSDEGQVSEQF